MSLSESIITGIRKSPARIVLTALMVKGARALATFCEEKPNPQIAAAISIINAE